MSYHILQQRIAIRCVVTNDYGYFSCRRDSRIVRSNQKVRVKELNIVTLTNSKSLQGNGRNQVPILQIYCREMLSRQIELQRIHNLRNIARL